MISIIALLSSVVLASLQSARSKARDQSTISGALQLRNAVEIYKTKNGYYPHQAPGVSTGADYYQYYTNPPTTPTFSHPIGGFDLASILVPGYIANIPSTNGQMIGYMSSGSMVKFGCTGNISDYPQYVIVFTLENPTDKFNLLNNSMAGPTPGLYCITVQ